MKKISEIRTQLGKIPGALIEFPPQDDYHGPEEGLEVEQLWEGPENLESFSGNRMNDVSEESEDFDVDLHDFEPIIEIAPEVEEVVAAFGGEEGQRIKRAIELNGVDALGWYSSFHITGVQWGIYIPISGIAYMASECLPTIKDHSFEKAITISFHSILAHELFHFATDCVVAQGELATQDPWWVPRKESLMDSRESYCLQEEKMANAYMLHKMRSNKALLRCRGRKPALKKFVGNQPEGYCNALHVMRGDWERELTELASIYCNHSAEGRKNPYLRYGMGWDWASMFQLYPTVDWRHCPIHIVRDERRYNLPEGFIQFFSNLSSISESNEFLDKLNRMGFVARQKWQKLKDQLLVQIPKGADFKKWKKESKKDEYSVRLGQNNRAHLKHQGNNNWLAFNVGTHKEMGHG